MNVSSDALRKETVATLKRVETVIASVEQEAGTRGRKAEDMIDQNGAWVMAPLLLAKAQCLHTLILLNEKK